MTTVPYVPFWCWNLLGEDALYFSQPTAPCPGDAPFADTGTCAARCTLESRLGDGPGGVYTHLIQCGRVATIAPDGEWLCTTAFTSGRS